MAERVIGITMTLDGKQTVKEAENITEAIATIEDELRNVSKAAADETATESLRELNKIVDENVLSIQELGAAADNYKNIALAAGTSSPVGQEALKKAAEMERQMSGLTMQVDSLAQRGQNLQAALQLSGTVIAGYTAFQGIQAAMGVENEELEKTFVKLQAAMSVMMGLQEIQNTLRAESILMQKAQVIWTKTQTAVTKAATVVQRVLNVVMKANPIGLIVTAIGLLVAGFVMFKDQIINAIKGLTDLKTVVLLLLGPIGWLILAYEKLFGEEARAHDEMIKRQKAVASAHKERLEQIKEEREANRKKFEETQEGLDLEIERLKAVGKNADDLLLQKLENNKAELEDQLLTIQKMTASWVQYYEDLWALSGKSREDFIEQMKGQGIDLEKLQQDNLELQQDYENKIFSSESKILDFKRQQREKDLQNAKDNYKFLEAEQLKFQDSSLEAYQKYLEMMRTTIEVEEPFDELFPDDEDWETFLEDGVSTMDSYLATIIGMADESKAFARAQFMEETSQLEEDLSLWSGMFMDTFNATNDLLNELGDRRSERIAAQRERDLKTLQDFSKKELAQEGLTAKSREAIERMSAFRKWQIEVKAAQEQDKIARAQFRRDKALKLAQVGIDTASAVMKGIAQFGPPPTPLGIAAVASAGAIGISQAAIIASQQFKGTAGNIQPPSFDTGGDLGPTSAGGGGTGTGTTGPGVQTDTGTATADLIPVVVSQVDINEQQQNLAKVSDISTIGG